MKEYARISVNYNPLDLHYETVVERNTIKSVDIFDLIDGLYDGYGSGEDYPDTSRSLYWFGAKNEECFNKIVEVIKRLIVSEKKDRKIRILMKYIDHEKLWVSEFGEYFGFDFRYDILEYILNQNYSRLGITNYTIETPDGAMLYRVGVKSKDAFEKLVTVIKAIAGAL